MSGNLAKLSENSGKRLTVREWKSQGKVGICVASEI